MIKGGKMLKKVLIYFLLNLANEVKRLKQLKHTGQIFFFIIFL